MTRRILPYEEWDRLRKPVKACFGEDKEPPSLDSSPLCAVEEDDNGNIIGFLFLQMCLHLEPFGSLGGASLSGLKNTIDIALTNVPNVVYYVCTNRLEYLPVLESKGFVSSGIALIGNSKGNI